jgi:hypothetical protein
MAGTLIAAIAITVAIGLLSTAAGLAASTSGTSTARRRADTVLWRVLRDLRRASLASLKRADGSSFADGDSDLAVSMQVIESWSGTAGAGPSVEYAFDAASGEVTRTEDGRTELLAREVTAFAVTRTADRLTVAVSARNGPADDRARSASARGQILPRNP